MTVVSYVLNLNKYAKSVRQGGGDSANEQQIASSSWDPFLADSLISLSLAIKFP